MVELTPLKVWDLPVRVIHWLLVLLVGGSWATAEFDLLPWHQLSGYLILTLVIVRIVWGFSGSTTARFSHFLKGPAAIKTYAAQIMRRGANASIGHNPLGGLSVLTLLGLLAMQAGLGLFAQDADGLAPGPLADLLTRQAGRAVAEAHEVVFNVLLLFIAVHIAAILFHACYKGEALIRPMLTGRKNLPADAAVVLQADLKFASGKWAFLIFIIVAAVIILVVAT